MDNQKDHDIDEVMPPPAKWSQDRRLRFIDFRLRWDGKVNRRDLIDYFEISLPQASADFFKYSEAAPNNLSYDVRLRTYQRGEKFESLYSRSAPMAYLNDLLAVKLEIVESKSSFIGWLPEVGIAPTPPRPVDGSVLAIALDAIREKRKVSLTYQSMSRPEPVEREISPHALGYDGFRWHVRAYCHLRENYQDFVFGRMTNVVLGASTEKTGADDDEWNKILTLEIAAHPGLPIGAKRAIEMEYGMKDGFVALQCRQSLLFYALGRLGLRTRGTDVESESNGAAQQIVLRNRADLEPYLVKVKP
jgi:hypothetical protein